MAVPLADSESLAVLVGGPALDGADGQFSAWAVGVVSGLVRGYTRLTVTPVTAATLVLTGTPSRRLIVGERPLTAVTSVTLDGTVLDIGEYSWHRTGVLIRRAGWGSPDVEVQVVASYGFATVPDDLRAVVESASMRLTVNPGQWRSLPADGAGEGELTAAFPAGFTVSELAVLNRYRRRTG